MYRIVIFAVVVAAASAAPGYLGGDLAYGGLGHGVALAPAPIAVAHAPIAVAHAPVATSYANSNLISRTIGVRTIAAHAPVVAAHAPVVAAPVALGYGSYGGYGGYGSYGHGGLALGGLGHY